LDPRVHDGGDQELVDGCILHWMISCFHSVASHGQDLYSYASITQLTMAVKTPIIKKRTKPFKCVQANAAQLTVRSERLTRYFSGVISPTATRASRRHGENPRVSTTG
jgi:hypothetical protein